MCCQWLQVFCFKLTPNKCHWYGHIWWFGSKVLFSLFSMYFIQIVWVIINLGKFGEKRRICFGNFWNCFTHNLLISYLEKCLFQWNFPFKCLPTKKYFHHSGGIPVELHWSHGKWLENDWNKWNLWNSSEIPLEFQQFIILTPLKFHL